MLWKFTQIIILISLFVDVFFIGDILDKTAQKDEDVK